MPLLCDVQALASTSYFGTPRRTVGGADTGRVALLLAVRKGMKAAGNLLLDAHWLGFAEIFGLMLFAIVLYPALFQWAERRKSKS